MKIKIIQPYIGAQALFSHKLRGLARFSTQLGPLVVAALTPDDFEIDVINEHLEEIDYEAPVDIVGISTLTANITRAYRIADRFKEEGVTVVIGGIHASFLPEEAIDHCDAVVIGEAEYSWPRLLKDWKKGKLKQFYRSDKLSHMADIPIPRRDLDLTVGFTDKIEASRGCPFDCDFCSTNLHFGRKHRTRPIPKLIEDINSIYRHKIHMLMFADDNIAGNPRYAKELFEAMKPLNFQWGGQSSVSIADNLELLELATKCGCKGLSVGFESLSEANLRESGKLHNKVKKYEEQIKRMKEAGLVILANFMFGFDFDDKSVFERTVEFVIRHDMQAYFTIITPYPRTGLRARILKERRLLHSDWSLYDTAHCVIKPKLMEPDELEEGLRWAYQQIYPGKKVLIEDPKELYKDFKLTDLSKLLLKIKRGKENKNVPVTGIKQLLGDAVLDLKLRAQMVKNPEEAVRNGEYALGNSEMNMLKRIVRTENPDDLFPSEEELPLERVQEYINKGLWVVI